MKGLSASMTGFGIVAALLGNAAVAVNIDMVAVGNAGNAPDTRYARPGYGAVAYAYQMGKYEVTAGQYTEFLNAVDGVDKYGLYNPYTWSSPYGCKISRSGGGTQANPYVYDVAPEWANRPVNHVSWGDAARFVNWLANGRPRGTLTGNPVGDAGLTEDGSYHLNGATSYGQLAAVTRRPGATWVIPCEDEWYKAAYYDPNKPGGPGYWDYPTRSNVAPDNIFDPAGTNNANYYRMFGTPDYSIGAPYYRTEVGALVASPGPYGTFDQGGNVWEWNESLFYLRAGSFSWNGADYLSAGYRWNLAGSVYEAFDVGFRCALVPEPSSLAFVLLGAALSRRANRGLSRKQISTHYQKAML